MNTPATCHHCKTEQGEVQMTYAGPECIDRRACLARADERLDRIFRSPDPEGATP